MLVKPARQVLFNPFLNRSELEVFIISGGVEPVRKIIL
jgi:hypothetical protein